VSQADTQPLPALQTPSLPFALQDGEQVVLFTRRHWLYLWPMLVFRLFVGLAPLGLVLGLAALTLGFGSIAGRILLVLGVLWAGYWLVRAYFGWYSYSHDIWVVTNQRIVDANRPSWFKSRLASADLVDVQDIAVEQSGPLQTMLHYGNVRCQTAGERENFVLGGIPHPTNVLAVVDSTRDAARRAGRQGFR
jgi:hypothetical protein